MCYLPEVLTTLTSGEKTVTNTVTTTNMENSINAVFMMRLPVQVEINMLIDTGAVVSLMNVNDF